MPQLDLTPEEADALATGLASYLDDLQEEISHTDDYDFRHALQHRRTLLKGIVERVTRGA